MMLYKLPRGTKLKLQTENGLEVFTFQNPDGMFSLSTRDSDEMPVYLSVLTPMIKVGNFYEIKDV